MSNRTDKIAVAQMPAQVLQAVWAKLEAQLGREPSHEEVAAEVMTVLASRRSTKQEA